MTNQHVNAVVVGAGAGGGVVASVLAEAGLSVVVLERGCWQSYHSITDDELMSQRAPRLVRYPGPDNRPTRKAHLHDNGNYGVVVPNNASCVGSGTLTYGAMAWRFMEQDFKMRTLYGAPQGSSLDDWPISYNDIEHCYERAEWEIGVAGDHTQNPFAAPRKRGYPMPPFPYSREAEILIPAIQRLGWHPFPAPVLRNSIPYNGRPSCIHERSCVGFACPINAKNGTQNTVIPKALATGNCELRTECMVSEVLVDDHGKVRGVHYYDGNDRLQKQTADLVVLSAAATGTARILLNSKSRLFPNGAGNNSDCVGRNVQGHLYVGAFGFMEQEVYSDAGPGLSVAFCDFNHGNPGLCGGGLLANDFQVMPYVFSNIRPHGAPRWGVAHKRFQRDYYRRLVRVVGPIQEIPTHEARIVLNHDARDYWGVPLIKTEGMAHPHDVEAGNFLASKAELLLQEIGAEHVTRTAPAMGTKRHASTGGQHQAGTCRMGNDPQTSVTNRFGQLHDIDNLFIADGSLHVTNGGFNPVLTIMALGYWVGEYIVNAWRGGGKLRG